MYTYVHISYMNLVTFQATLAYVYQCLSPLQQLGSNLRRGAPLTKKIPNVTKRNVASWNALVRLTWKLHKVLHKAEHREMHMHRGNRIQFKVIILTCHKAHFSKKTRRGRKYYFWYLSGAFGRRRIVLIWYNIEISYAYICLYICIYVFKCACGSAAHK